MSEAIFHRHPDQERCIQHLSHELSTLLNQELAQKPRARLLLTGGSSPEPLLPLLARESLDWSRVDLCPTDERWVPANDQQSNWRLLHEGLPQANCLDPRLGPTPEQAASAWGDRLSQWRRFTAVLLGMGDDGHIASLFPGMPGLEAALDPQARPVALVGVAPSEPRTRLSPNLALLLDSDWLGLLVYGEDKLRLLESALADEPGSRGLPVHALLWRSPSAVQIHWAP